MDANFASVAHVICHRNVGQLESLHNLFATVASDSVDNNAESIVNSDAAPSEERSMETGNFLSATFSVAFQLLAFGSCGAAFGFDSMFLTIWTTEIAPGFDDLIILQPFVNAFANFIGRV